MSTFLLEGAPEPSVQVEALPDPVGVNGAEAFGAHSDLMVESLGDAAITLARQTADIESGNPMTDRRGNLLPVQTTDLREVANEKPWALEGPSVRRFVSLDVPTAIVKAYRTISPDVRGRVAHSIGGRGSSSHDALASIGAGGGWSAFWKYALPNVGPNGPLDWGKYGASAHGGPFDWAHYK